jgi:hypothetical protein
MDRSLLLTALATLSLVAPVSAQVRKASGGLELSRAAEDCPPVQRPTGDVPGFTIKKLSLQSDGHRLTIAVTLKHPPGADPDKVLDLNLDTDNNPRTGSTVFGAPDRKGFEFVATLYACNSYDNGSSSSCAGGTNGKVTGHYAQMELERYKGTDWMDREAVVDLMAMRGKKAPKLDIAGNVVQGALDYADLRVKPGQTIRVLAKEHCGGGSKDGGFFPDVVLTLK